MSKPVIKQYEDKENLMFVLKFPISVDFKNGDISTYQGEYASLIPTKREVECLKEILDFMQQDTMLSEKFENAIITLSGLYDVLKGSRDIFFDEVKKQRGFNEQNPMNKVQDTAFRFLDECCVDVTNAKTALSTAQMWQAFCQWCKLNNEYIPKRRTFTKSIANRYHTEEYMIIKKSGDKRYYPFTLSDKYVDEYKEVIS